jgi:hypothetical protein
VTQSSTDWQRCFIVVLAQPDPRKKPTQRPLSLAGHGASIDAFRRAARSAARQIADLFKAHQRARELLVVDVSSSDRRDQPPTPYAWQVFRSLVDDDSWWLATQGRLSGTLDGARLCGQVKRDAAAVIGAGDAIVVVTNRELTPGPGLRYVVWDCDATARRAAVSASQLDPYLVADETEGRFPTIERRLRAALASVIGELAGVARCDTPGCVMQRDLGLGAMLDDLTGYGPEHHDAGLGDVRFGALDDGAGGGR